MSHVIQELCYEIGKLKQDLDNEADEAQDADSFLKSPEVQAWKEREKWHRLRNKNDLFAVS